MERLQRRKKEGREMVMRDGEIAEKKEGQNVRVVNK